MGPSISLIRIFVLGIVLFMTFNVPAFAESNVGCCELNIDENDRIYISSEELLIIDGRMYYLQHDDAFPITLLHCDGYGIYINLNDMKKDEEVSDRCMNGHKIYHWDCLGCAHWFCPFRCKCYSPW